MPTTMKTYYAYEMTENILRHLENGATVHLQWKCIGCGDKITADEPVKLVLNSNNETCVALHKAYLHTTKDDGSLCGVSTPITAKAFNFMVMMGLRF